MNYPVDFNARSKDRLTPLMIAATYNHLDLIPRLLDKTTLSMSNIASDSALVEQISQYDLPTQMMVFQKALHTYITDRTNDADLIKSWQFKVDM